MAKSKRQHKKFKFSQAPWEIIALIVLLMIVGYVFYRLGQSTSHLRDGLFPN